MFNFFIQLLVLSSINSLCAGGTLTEFHINDAVPQTFQDFPCPDAADIAPCVCTYDSDSNRLTLDCTDISSDQELANILAKDFPVNDYYQFEMSSSSSLTALNFTCGGVKFLRFDLYPGPFPSLVEVTDDFYQSCSSSDLEYVRFRETQITSLDFPSPPLSDKIAYFYIYGSNFTSVPPISSDGLDYLHLAYGQISQLTTGTFDEIPNLRTLYLYNNNIKIMQTGSIPIVRSGYAYHLHTNGLETIEQGAFTLKGEPTLNFLDIYLEHNLLQTIDASVFEFLMPYINTLAITDNPLDCGCDLAWIILNPEYLEKVTRYGSTPACADGTLLTELDPSPYQEFC